MKTSLGIWAFSSMVTRFVPGGYQPEHAGETTVERVRRAVDGLGDLIDGYEFHYPQELNEQNVDEIREALGPDHDIYCLAGGLHLDPRFGRGGLVNPDPAVRAEAVRIAVAGAELSGRARRADDRLARDRGLQLPVPDALRGQLGLVHRRARRRSPETLKEHGQPLWLEHKNSEPAMKILMRNIGMTLFVIHELGERGHDNVKVNMDWQHLIMNGESLAEYAALLAVEGAARTPARELGLGHVRRRQHGRRDRVHGDARAGGRVPPRRLRRRTASGSASTSTRTPRTRSRRCGARVLQWRFIDGVAARIDDAALREAQSRKDAVRAYELVYAALGGVEPRRARRRHDRRQGGPRSPRRARCSPAHEEEYPLSIPQPGLGGAGPGGLVAGERAGARRGRAGDGPVGLTGQMHGLVLLDAADRVLRPAILWNDQRTGAECAEIEERDRLRRGSSS